MKTAVAIVGAGIAGLYSAMKLSNRGIPCTVFERKSKIGVPVQCGEATGNRAELSRFVTVDEKWIAGDIKGLAAHVNSDAHFVRPIPEAGVMLHRDRFELSLAREVQESGCEIRLNFNITGIREETNRTILKTEDGSEFQADIVIGADGPESGIGRQLGLTGPLDLDEAFSAAQLRVESTKYNDGFLHFFIGREVIHPGYIWVFPKSESHVSVGAGYYGAPFDGPPAVEVLRRFLDRNFPNKPRSHLISGCVPIFPSPRLLNKGRVLLVGDAARQCNPLTAGGIMNALEAADEAARTVIKALNQGDPKRLSEYSRKMRRKPRKEQLFYAMLKGLIIGFSDRELCRTLRTAEGAFAEPVRRDRPFAPPILKLAPLLGRHIPQIAANAGIMLK